MAETERRRVFFDQWAGVGFGKDIAAVGEAMPIDFRGAPLLAVRAEDGVRVFENVCRHRGMTLVKAKTKIRAAICCPCHAWCYDLNGRLLSTPLIGGPGINSHPDVDRTTLGLTRVRCFVWHDVIFVNLSGTAPPFDVVHADLMARWREFDTPLYAGTPGILLLAVRALQLEAGGGELPSRRSEFGSRHHDAILRDGPR